MTGAGAPQHAPGPVETRRAAWPYRSFTRFLMANWLMAFSFVQQVMVSGWMALFRVRHSA
jgi:hypothetical protein